MFYQTAVFFACNDPDGLQKQMNDFFAENVGTIKVVDIKATASGRMDHKVTVVVLYEVIEK